MKTLEYFEDLSSTFDFVPMTDLELEETIDKIGSRSRELHTQISDLEKQVKVVESDVESLAELGLRLIRDDSKEKLRQLTEDFLLESNVSELRCQLAELYGARQSIARCVSKLAVFDESLNTSCSICMEHTVSMFNHNCGHTACDSCATKVTRCPICRSTASFRRIMYSS
jgi:hypothetical protein